MNKEKHNLFSIKDACMCSDREPLLQRHGRLSGWVIGGGSVQHGSYRMM